MDFPYGETVTVRTVVTITDDDGNTTSTPAEASWGPCAVWDRYSAERVDPRQAPIVAGLSIAGPRRDFDPDDVVVRDGVEYQVDGLPEANTVSPFTGWDPGIVVNVKRAGAV